MGIKKPHTDNKMTSGIDLSGSQYSWLGRWVGMSDIVSILSLLPYEIASTANPYIGVSYLFTSPISVELIPPTILPNGSFQMNFGTASHHIRRLEYSRFFSWTKLILLSSMFYFGYLAWEYPTNRLLQRLPLGKYCMYSWTPFGHAEGYWSNSSCIQYHHVGSCIIMLCGRWELFRSNCNSILPWRFWGCGNSWLRSFHLPMVYQEGTRNPNWHLVQL